MILDLVRTNGEVARTKLLFKFSIALLFGLILSIVGQNSVIPPAHGNIFGTGYNAPYAGGGGGNQNGVAACPANMVAVGVGFTVNGNSPGFGVYCRAVGTNGQLVAQDQSSTANTSAVGGGNTRVFCSPGQVVTGISFRLWTNVRIRCATPPLLNDNAQTAWALAATGTEFFTNCNANGIVAGFYTRTGAWTDAIGAYCLPYNLSTLSYNVNGGSGTAPPSQTQTTAAQQLTVSSAYTGTRARYTFAGWNTQANGLGVDYANGSSIRPLGATTLFAKWTSTITYNGNSPTAGSVPNPTTAVSSAAVTNLSPNNGSSVSPNVPLTKTGFSFFGWNTEANGSGTSFPASNPTLVTETPYMHFEASNFNDGTNAWTDSSTNTRNIPGTAVSTNAGNIRGNPTKVTNAAGTNGAQASFDAVLGTPSDGIVIGNDALANFTFCHVARYAGGTRARMFAGTTGNWLSGYWSSQAGVAHPGNWITSSSGSNDTNWRVMCQIGGTVSGFRSNGVDRTTVTNNTSGMPANISINLQGSRTGPSETSDWAVAEFIIYDSILSTNKIQEIEERLNRKYLISAFTPSVHTYNYASTGDITLFAQWNSTISYNGNGNTGGAVPAPTIAKGTAANTTLANAGTMVRAGFTFTGWNTQADGLGTNYASGLTTFASTGNTTLFARWTAVITYDSNGASGSPATSSSNSAPRTSDLLVNSLSPIALSNLPTVGTMVRPGFTFGGWNTAANGTGTNFSQFGTYPSNMPRPYMRFKADNFDDATNAWTDTSGNNRHIPGTPVSSTAGNIRGNPTLVDATGNGATANFKAVKGDGTSGNGVDPDGIVIGNEALASFTFCHVARYAGATRGRIFAGVSGNWLSGYWSNRTGVAHPEAWITSDSGTNDTNWRVMCQTGGPTSGFRSNGVVRTTVTNNTTPLPANITINLQGSRTAPSDQTDWEVAEFVIYSGILNTFQLEAIEDSLKTTYGITGFTAPTTPASAGAFTPTGNTTLFARWLPNAYNLTFDTSTVTSGVMTNQWFSAGTTFNLPANTFARTGFTFRNWNTASNGSGTTYTNNQSVTLFDNLNLFPQWNLIAPGVPTVAVSAGNTEVTVTPTPAAASGTTVGPTTSMLVTAFTSAGVALTNPARTCSVIPPATSCVITGLTNGVTYQFGATATNATATSAASTRVNGTPAGVLVTFDATSNSGAMSSFSLTNRALTSSIATLTTSAAHGLAAGMRVTITGTTTVFDGTYTVLSTPTATTFTYDRTGQSNVTSVSSSGSVTLSTTSTFNKGTPVVLPSATRSGYIFSGWYTTQSSGGSLVGAAGATYSPTAAITLFARFSGIVYTINYNGNGNTGGVVPSTGTYETGSGAHIVGAAPQKVGYTFVGWTTNANGTGTTYQPSASLTPSANVSLFAQWSGNTNTISYDANTGTGSVPASGSYVSGAATAYTVLAKPDGLTKTGSDFIGWNTAANGSGTSYSAGAALTTLANTVLYAQWSASTYSYSYQLNGGTSAQPASGTAAYNAAITLPTAPTREGFTFTGWNDGSPISLSTTTVNLTSNKIFVAQWTAQSFTITFDGNNAFGGVNTTGSVANGSYVSGGVPYSIAANGFAKAGYNFAGWKNSAGTIFVVGSGYSTPTNLTLIAQWTPASYTITYNANGATSGAPAVASETWTFSPTTPLALSAAGNLLKTGFTFSGWALTANSNTGVTSASPTSNATYFAVWTPTQFTVSYAAGAGASGTVASPGNKIFGETFTLDSASSLTPPPTNANVSFSFAFWSDGNKTYKRGATYVMPAENVVLTANWIAIYNVTYNPNGGNSSIANIQKAENDPITIEVAATRTGYNFVKWEDQSLGLWNPGETTTVTAGRFLFNAQWSPKNNAISFNGNNNTGGSVPANGTYVTDAAAYVIPGNSGSLVRTGYTFIGWNTLADGTGIDYPAGVGATYSVPADLALFAKWQANTYVITYNGNGATGGLAPDNGSYVTGSVNPLTVAANRSGADALSKTGFSFDGWYTTATGTGGTSYSAGTGTLTTTSDLTLFAKWSSTPLAVTYVTGVGASTAPTQADSSFGATFNLPSAPTRTGFDFIGWGAGSDPNATVYAPGSSYTMGSSAITFTARWSGLSYVVVYLLNGGAGVAPTQANVLHGEGFTAAVAPTRAGFTFSGWSDGADLRSAGASVTNVTSNRTLTAQWTIAVPGTPGTPTVTPGNGSATITIAAPTTGGTPSSYTVTASPGGATCTVTVPGTSCTIAPLTNGTAYIFTSTATNTTGTSTSASAASAAVTPAGIPDSPTGVTGTGLGGTANISWTLPVSDGGSAITDYVIEYSVEGSGTWTTFADGVSTATSATVTGLTAGNAYEFRVSAKNLIGNSLPSFTSPVVEALPTAPTITGTTAASGQVTVTWNAPTHIGSGIITDYTITAYAANGNVAGTCNPDPGQRTCVVSGLDNGSPYTFKAVATTTVGDSVESSATSPVIPAGVPSAPSDVTAVTSGSNMTITFTAPTDNGGAAITSYVITSSPAGATCTVGANATTYTCTGLTAGTNYTYTVKAVNNKGESSASLASTGVTAVARPSAPLNVSAVITAGTTTLSATVSFDPPANENGSPVTSYTVTAAPGGATCTVTAPTTYCDIPVLPDRVYTFSVTATNAVGTSIASASSLEIKATNGIAPTLVTDPIPAPTGDFMESKVLSSNIGVSSFNSTPNSVVTYQWKRCTDPLVENSCSNISGATSSTYALTSTDVDDYIRVEVTATNSIGTITKLSEATEVILATPTAPSTPTTPTTPVADPVPAVPTCEAACQAARAASAAKAAADAAAKAAADAAAKAAADRAAADAAAKLKADADARTASDRASAAAKAAADAAKIAVERAGAAAAAKAAADAQAAAAAVQAKAAADAQAAANRAAATAAATLKSSAASAAAKAAATASAQKAAADAQAAVKAAATAAQQAVTAKNTAANANKQVDIAINSLNSKTAASQASAQANAIAAAAKAAANEAATAAAAKAAEAKARATAAQKDAAATAARIATEQKEAATAAAAAKAAADAAAKATAEKTTAANAAKTASENLLKFLEEKATLAEQAAKSSDEAVREEITKKLEEIETEVEAAAKIAEEATAEAEDAIAEYEEAVEQAAGATKVAETQTAEAVAVKAESVTKTAIATKAVAAAAVAAKVATAAKAAAAQVPSKATIIPKASTSTSKNSATATVTGLKPGQKVKVTVNVKPKP